MVYSKLIMPLSHKTNIQVPTLSFTRFLSLGRLPNLSKLSSLKLCLSQGLSQETEGTLKGKIEQGLMKEIHQGMMKNPGASNSGDSLPPLRP